MKLDEELERCGCRASEKAFCTIVAEWRATLFPQFSAEEFLAHSDAVREFAKHMASLFGCSEISDEAIAAAISSTPISPELKSMSATKVDDGGSTSASTVHG
jgi:hypothetical protein